MGQLEGLEIVAYLASLGVTLPIDWGWERMGSKTIWNPRVWSISDLRTIQRGVADLAAAMGGAAAFQANLRGVTIRAGRGNRGKAHLVELAPGAFDLWGVVHELAHAWDAVSGLGWRLQRQLGCSWLNYGLKVFHGWWKYDLGEGPPPAGVDKAFDPYEDFAEAVVAFVYPDEAWKRAQERNHPYSRYGYPSFYETPRGKFIQSFMDRLYMANPHPYIDRVP